MGKFQLEATFTDKDGLQTHAYSLDFDTLGKLSLSQVIGTSCSELFRWVDLVKSSGKSKLKTTGGHFDLVMRCNSLTIDTAKGSKMVREGFFFNKKEDSRSRFARRVLELARFMATAPKVTSVEELEEKAFKLMEQTK